MSPGRALFVLLTVLGALELGPTAIAVGRVLAQGPGAVPAGGAPVPQAPAPDSTTTSPAPVPSTPAPEPDPGVPASAEVTQEIQALVAAAVTRFHAKDTPGVLAHVSEQYRTGVFTKGVVRKNLRTIFGLYDVVQVRVRLDAVRMVGDHAWVFSTGEITGRVRFVGTWADVLWWDRELEIARRENGVWRLYGYQQ
jgi:hypothetical protein